MGVGAKRECRTPWQGGAHSPCPPVGRTAAALPTPCLLRFPWQAEKLGTRIHKLRARYDLADAMWRSFEDGMAMRRRCAPWFRVAWGAAEGFPCSGSMPWWQAGPGMPGQAGQGLHARPRLALHVARCASGSARLTLEPRPSL